MERQIIHNWFVSQPPETVWQYLTTPKLLAQWLMKNDIKPVVGHKFKFSTRPLIKMGFDGNVYCEVLEVTPYTKFSYSWRGGPGNGKVALDSIVTWTLTPIDGGTQLQLMHSGFKGMRNLLAWFFMDRGWNGKIKHRLTNMLNAHTDETIAH